MRDDEKEFKHESYGLARFSRCTGSTGKMFGSSLPTQHSYIILNIAPGLRKHHLSRDWYHHDTDFNNGREYIEVAFTAAQFAELITSLNAGIGVPCTIQYLDGRRVESPPNELLEAEQIREDFAETTAELAKRMKVFEKQMNQVFEKKTPVTAKDKEELRGAYEQVVQHVKSNMPFVIDQFHEAASKIITDAKAEVDAFMLHAVLQAGFKAIAEGGVEAPQLISARTDDK